MGLLFHNFLKTQRAYWLALTHSTMISQSVSHRVNIRSEQERGFSLLYYSSHLAHSTLPNPSTRPETSNFPRTATQPYSPKSKTPVMSPNTIIDIPFHLASFRPSIIDLPPEETCYVCMRPFGTQDNFDNPLDDPACEALRLSSCPHVIGSHCVVELWKRGRLNCSMCAVPMKVRYEQPMHPTIMWAIGTEWFKCSFRHMWTFMLVFGLTGGMGKTTRKLCIGKATVVQAVLLWMRYVTGLLLWKLCCHILMLLAVDFVVAVFQKPYEYSPFLVGNVSGVFLLCFLLWFCFGDSGLTWSKFFAYMWGIACTQHLFLPECAAAFELVDFFLKSTVFGVLIWHPMVWKRKAD